jgi:hypothetical protein
MEHPPRNTTVRDSKEEVRTEAEEYIGIVRMGKEVDLPMITEEGDSQAIIID